MTRKAPSKKAPSTDERLDEIKTVLERQDREIRELTERYLRMVEEGNMVARELVLMMGRLNKNNDTGTPATEQAGDDPSPRYIA